MPARQQAGLPAQDGARLGPCPSRAAPARRHADAAVGGVPRSANRTAMPTAAGASSTAPGRAGCRRRCARPIPPASACSSTMPARPSRSDRRPAPARCAPAQVFVAAMGASNYTYAEATLDPDAARLDRRACRGRSPSWAACRRSWCPDNPKVGVDRANWYEPGLNRTYLDLATHYGTAILPTRTRKPRDKAKVEVAVLVVERWILARLRNRRFFSLAELNRGDRRAGRRPQCAADAPPRRQPPRSVPRARPSGAQAAAGRAPTSMPSGGCGGSGSTTTSTSTATTTRCRTG